MDKSRTWEVSVSIGEIWKRLGQSSKENKNENLASNKVSCSKGFFKYVLKWH